MTVCRPGLDTARIPVPLDRPFGDMLVDPAQCLPGTLVAVTLLGFLWGPMALAGDVRLW